MAEPQIPTRACERCKGQRMKCDKLHPTCSRCLKNGQDCVYLIKNAAGIFSSSVADIELKLALLEEELSHHLQKGGSVVADHRPEAEHPPVVQDSPISITSSENLVVDLFGEVSEQHMSNEVGRDGIDGLVNDISQVSLSATTLDTHGSFKNSILPTIIFAAACPSGLPTRRMALRLPPKHIAEKIVARYVRDILPGLPFIDEHTLFQYFHDAYNDSPYASFCLVTVLATTSRCISSSTAERSTAMYITGLQCLEHAFSLSRQSNSLQELESVLFLAQYASVVGDEEAKVWALSGIALRICVDLGLHKSADSAVKSRLFWSSYALDRSIAIALHYPFGISDAVIDTPHTGDNDVFYFRRLQSAVYTAETPVEESRVQNLREDLEDWYHRFQPREKSTAIEMEFISLIYELDRMAGLSPVSMQEEETDDRNNFVPWYIDMKY